MLVLFTLCQQRTVTAEALAHVLQKGTAETEGVSAGWRRTDQECSNRRGVSPTAQAAVPAEGGRHQGHTRGGEVHRRTVDEIDRKVISHLHEHGKITTHTSEPL